MSAPRAPRARAPQTTASAPAATTVPGCQQLRIVLPCVVRIPHSHHVSSCLKAASAAALQPFPRVHDLVSSKRVFLTEVTVHCCGWQVPARSHGCCLGSACNHPTHTPAHPASAGAATSCPDGKYLYNSRCHACPAHAVRPAISSDYTQCTCLHDRPWVAATLTSAAYCGTQLCL